MGDAMKILHLEDDPMKASIISRHMAKGRDERDVVTWVMNWKAFQECVHDGPLTCDGPWDLLILDICVPFWAAGDGPSNNGIRDLGKESRREARRAGYTGPIIFISANPRGLDLGCDPSAHAYFYRDTAGWLGAIAVVRAEVEG